MKASGVDIALPSVTYAMFIPSLGMIAGLFIAIFISYRKDRELLDDKQDAINEVAATEETKLSFTLCHFLTIIAIIGAFIVQLVTGSLVLGALTGIILMFLFTIVPFKEGEKIVNEGIMMMGMISFVLLIASGYATILKETGAVEDLVQSTIGILGDNKIIVAIAMITVGLLITMGIGSSFGTIPLIAALFVPICTTVGFSPLATAALIGTASSLGDAGSPVSDSTLGPTIGLNADGKHHHIWDTCVPTFLHFGIPLMIFGIIAAMVL
jgi:predicted histidine transporter YuiF (NhaC family)